jgi:hypothetical protein
MDLHRDFGAAQAQSVTASWRFRLHVILCRMPAICSVEVRAARVRGRGLCSGSQRIWPDDAQPADVWTYSAKESARIGREAGVGCLRRIHHARAGLWGEKRCEAQYERDTTRKARTARSLNAENRTGPRKNDGAT